MQGTESFSLLMKPFFHLKALLQGTKAHCCGQAWWDHGSKLAQCLAGSHSSHGSESRAGIGSKRGPNHPQWLLAKATFPGNEGVKNERGLALFINIVYFCRSPFPSTSKALCVARFTASSDAELSLFLDPSLG